MSLEEIMQDNSAAMRELASALRASKPSATTAVVTATPTDGRRPPGRPKKISLDAVKIAAEKVREAKGRPAAYELIKAHGGEKLTDLPEAQYAAFIAACDVILMAEERQPEEAEPEADDSL